MIKTILKTAMKKAPLSFKAKQSLLDFCYRQYEAEAFQRLIKNGHTSVISGPFKGLKFKFTHSNKNFRTVHLLGMFETCIHETVNELAAKHDTIVNIGCGTGYYTNGLAHSMRNQKSPPTIKGYDIDAEQIAAAEDLREYNNITNVSHFCVKPEHDYSELKGQKAFAIIDIEGAEYPLLTNQKEAFVNSDMLIEIHDSKDYSAREGLEYLTTLFSETHDARIINESKTTNLSVQNDIGDSLGNIAYLGLHMLPCENRKHAMQWLVLRRKA